MGNRQRAEGIALFLWVGCPKASAAWRIIAELFGSSSG
jgi:hypothetical protein